MEVSGVGTTLCEERREVLLWTERPITIDHRAQMQSRIQT